MVLGFLKSKKAKLKDAERKRKTDKIKSYKKLQDKMLSDTYDASDKSHKGKRGRRILRDSINKQDRKSGKIAKYMPDIAGDIKASGDPTLKGINLLKTKYRKGKDARAAGAFSKGGSVKLAKKYFKGGIV
tara:strand:+ start:106 stop:495 length:390 start_codon:yes stop_codon:yes gene_type:complete